jgi:hypothetical protein
VVDGCWMIDGRMLQAWGIHEPMCEHRSYTSTRSAGRRKTVESTRVQARRARDAERSGSIFPKERRTQLHRAHARSHGIKSPRILCSWCGLRREEGRGSLACLTKDCSACSTRACMEKPSHTHCPRTLLGGAVRALPQWVWHGEPRRLCAGLLAAVPHPPERVE